MAKCLIQINLLKHFFAPSNNILSKIKTINKSIEFYVIHFDGNKMKIDDLKGELFNNSFLPAKHFIFPSEHKYDSYSNGKIFIHIVQAEEDKINESANILPDIDTESALELIYAELLELDVLVAKDPDLFAYQESELNESISWSIVVEDTEFLMEMIRHQDDELSKEGIQIVHNLIQEYGQEDWGNWHFNYDKLEANLDVIKKVLDIYLQRKDYERLKSAWQCLNRFCDLYKKYHNLRLEWLSILISLARKEKDWNYYISASTSKAWTYIMQGNLQSAGSTLEQIKNDLFLVTEEREKISFYYCLCTYHIHCFDDGADKSSASAQEHLKEASFCIKKQQEITEQMEANYPDIPDSQLFVCQDKRIDKRKIQRHRVNTLRNIAKLSYVQGKLDISLEDYQEVLRQSKNTNHLRSLCYAHNKLADIYLDFADAAPTLAEKEENIKKAQKHLHEGKLIAEENKNDRRIAAYCMSEARLSKIQGREQEAHDKSVEASKYWIPYQAKKYSGSIK